MIYSFIAPALYDELEQLKKIIARNEREERRTVIFCEDRLTLVAERAICAAAGGTFNTSVYTFQRFLSKEGNFGKPDMLSSQGSAMAIRAIIEANRAELRLFKRLSADAAAQAIYDTIAVLYSSGIDIAALISLDAGSPILTDKLHDISYIYTLYEKFLNESGKVDRNMYLRLLPDVIESSPVSVGADIILLGFQAFTGTTLKCVKACMRAGENVYGIFTGGAQDIYTNEAAASFEGCAKEFGGCGAAALKGGLCAEAEELRQNLFEPTAFGKGRKPMPTGNVHLFEGADETEEIEFIAANIKKHVMDDGMRYAKISVMLPAAGYARGTLERVFGQYKIPCYIDESPSLDGHPLADFILSYMECVAGGCAPDDVCAVTGSFLFGCTQRERDIFRNYVARCAFYRGGVKREPSKDVCIALGFDFDAVAKVRKRFLEGLALLPQREAPAMDWSASIAQLLDFFGCEKTLEDISVECRDKYPAKSQFFGRVYEYITRVTEEAAGVVPMENYSARGYKKIIKSGFAAAEISLIPPKADAVFVGDISSTVNAGSDVVFACGLTDAVPPAGGDTALLTDREITSLEKLRLMITPKIAQVNRRSRETVALNLCAFKKQLYVSYPAQTDGAKSEIISYISKIFCNLRGSPLAAVTLKQIRLSGRGVPYYCCEPVPALNCLASGTLKPQANAAVYRVLQENGSGYAADKALTPPAPKEDIDCGKELFTGGRTKVSPTLLEAYFSCPYKNFLSKGINLSERKEGDVNPLDTGNFIHEVLNGLTPLFKTYGGHEDVEEQKERAREQAKVIADGLLKTPKYRELGESLGGKYMVQRILSEAQEVAAGACEQILAGSFRIKDSEQWYYLDLGGGMSVGGKIDRVDRSESGLVRVIDYKTGSIDIKLEPYYAGTKLQLPLYLSAASAKGGRPAGAYYFPANIDFKDDDGVFTLQGYMDVSEDVVKATDAALQPKEKSRYCAAKYGAKQPYTNMPRDVFADFISYSALIARKGAGEIFSGCIKPSPYEDACRFCKYGGMCGYSPDSDGDTRKIKGVTGADIAQTARREREGEKNDG